MSAFGDNPPVLRECRVRLQRCDEAGVGRPADTRTTQDIIKCEAEADTTLIRQELDLDWLQTVEADDVSIKGEVGADGTLVKQEFIVLPPNVETPTDGAAAPSAQGQSASVNTDQTPPPPRCGRKMARNLGTGEDHPDEFFDALYDEDDDYDSDDGVMEEEEEWLDGDAAPSAQGQSASVNTDQTPPPPRCGRKMARNLGTGEDHPDEFFDALYDEDDDYDSDDGVMEEEEEWLDGDDEFDAAATSRLVTSDDENENEASSARARSPLRSRSPLQALKEPQQDVAYTVVMYDTAGKEVNASGVVEPSALQDMDVVMADDMEIEEDVFWVPDAHALFGSVDEIVNDKLTGDPLPNAETEPMNVKRHKGRGQARGRGRRTGPRTAPQGRRPRAENDVTFIRGDPVNVVYVHDEDVPEDVRRKVLEVLAERAESARKAKAKRDAKIERLAKLLDQINESEDVFFDAFDGSITDTDNHNDTDNWSSMDTFQSREETFLPERTGAVHAHATPYSAFRGYWDDEILSHIVRETNRYAECHPTNEWYLTNTHEILVLFAFWMMLGIIRMPSIASCFTVQPLLKVDIFRKLFSHTRYQNLEKHLHFVDTSNRGNVTAATSDRLFKIRPVLEHLNRKFKEAYIPDKDICIDESLTSRKGASAIRQYIRTKAAMLGIKTFQLCESATGYLWSFLVSPEKQESPESEGGFLFKSTSAVIKLIKPLLRRGHRLFMNTWSNSPVLARFLKRNGTDCVGTLAPARAYVPPMVTMVPLNKGELTARHSGDVCVMAWQDQKRVTALSTCHGVAMGLSTVPSKVPARPLPFKLQVVLDYDRWMSGVDLKDQTLEPYLNEQKHCAKWCMKLFKRLLNCSILNAHILVKSSTKKHQDPLAFRLHLVHEILERHLPFIPQRPTTRRSKDAGPGRLVPTPHWPVRVNPEQSFVEVNRRTTKRCVVCYREGRKTIRSPFKCETCDVPLCIDPCFKSYHQQNH